MTATTDAPELRSDIERVFRDVSGQAVATLIRVFGDISIAEDAVQDAFVVASDRWRRDGIPPNPPGWIITTARNRSIDRLRRVSRGRDLEARVARDPTTASDAAVDHTSDEGSVHDDRLRLIFTCCHPALRPEHQVALTLRLLGGLEVDEIARSFLVSEAAMAKRLVRAKYKIKAANIPYRTPTDADLPDRLRSVLAVVYLIYNAGADGSGRESLRSEALRLVRSLVELMPDEAEADGLLALILLSESRMPTRMAGDRAVLLRDQDRNLWDRDMITEGHAIVRACVRRGRPGPFQLQAAIQAVHCDAATFEVTDWSQIVELYDHLWALTPTPVVALNRAIAIGEVAGPHAALAQLDSIAPELGDFHRFHAARGSMLRRMGDAHSAASAFRTAADLAPTARDRTSLLAEIDVDSS